MLASSIKDIEKIVLATSSGWVSTVLLVSKLRVGYMKKSAYLWKWLIYPFSTLERLIFFLRVPSMTIGVSKSDSVPKNSFSSWIQMRYLCWTNDSISFSFARADAAFPSTSTSKNFSPREHSESRILSTSCIVIFFGCFSNKA